MKKNKVLSAILSLVTGITSVISMASFEEANAETSQETAVGTVFLRYGNAKNPSQIKYMQGIQAENIASDGRYDMTWSIKDAPDFDTAESIFISIERICPYFLGKPGVVKLSIEEVWLDGAKAEENLEWKPVFTAMTDTSVGTAVCEADAWLKRSDNPDFTAEDTIRVVFSLTGLMQPEGEQLQGDVNGDNFINAVDSSLVLSHYAYASTNSEGILNEAQRTAADMNGDNKIDAQDASVILSCYAKLSVTSDKSE